MTGTVSSYPDYTVTGDPNVAAGALTGRQQKLIPDRRPSTLSIIVFITHVQLVRATYRQNASKPIIVHYNNNSIIVDTGITPVHRLTYI